MGRIWPAGRRLPAHGLNERRQGQGKGLVQLQWCGHDVFKELISVKYFQYLPYHTTGLIRNATPGYRGVPRARYSTSSSSVLVVLV